MKTFKHTHTSEVGTFVWCSHLQSVCASLMVGGLKVEVEVSEGDLSQLSLRWVGG